MRFLFLFVLFFSYQLGFAAPSGYSYFKKLSIQESQISVNSNSLSNFPVLVRITDADLKSTNSGGKVRVAKGYDIIFTAADGNTLLPFQLEEYDSLTGELVAWVKLPIVSATVNTDFFMYFGNSTISANLGSKTTWDANYKGVYHLNSDVTDWTSNGANLTNTGTTNLSPAVAADGQRIAVGTYLSRAPTTGLQITGDLTIEAWMNINSLLSGSNENIVLSSSASGSGSTNNINYSLSIDRSSTSSGNLILRWQYSNNSDEMVTSGGLISTSVAGFHYVTVVRDNTAKQVRFYFDGAQLGSAISYSNSATGGSANSFLIGKNLEDASRSIDSGFDEVRISNSTRSPEWIQAAYNSYKPASTFITYSATSSVSPTSFCFCSVDMIDFNSLGTFNSHSYFLSNNKTTWQQADSIANKLGGHLVSITTAAENTFLTLSSLGLTRVWTGLNDSVTEGTFVWSSGELFSFSNWSALQPNGSGDYVLFNTISLGLWDDVPNSSQFFIVEFDCIAPAAFIVDAGPDQNICSSATNLTAAAIPATAFGQWSLLSGAGIIANINSPTTSVSGLSFGNNSFIWKAANGSCDPVNDTIVIHTDTVRPTIVCSSDINITTSAGVCTGTATWTTPTFNDNCSGASIVQIAGLPSGSAFPIGVNTITYRVTDSNGNSRACSFIVTVTDTENPKINCPGNLNFIADPGTCGAVVTGISPINTTDNCIGFTVDYIITGATNASGLNDASGVFFNLGTSTVRYTITDAVGRSVACNFNVSISDNTPPVFTFCPSDIIANVDAGLCSALVSWIAPVASDNCPGLTLNQTSGLPSGSAFPVGITSIKYVVTDTKGSSSNCTFSVTVVDTIPPSIGSCPSNITVPASAGMCTGIVNWANPLAIDNCSGATISQVAGPTSGSAFPIGTTVITYKAIDAANLSSLCSFTVTVIDTENPLITNCPLLISATNSPGLCSAPVTWTALAVTDNCSGATISQITGPASGSIFPVGITPVSYTAFDVAGNSTTCNFNIDVVDDEAPVITCPADVIVSNDNGACTAAVVGIGPASVSDNCAGFIVNYTISGATSAIGSNDASGTTFNLGSSQIDYSVKDGTGSIRNCSFTVTVAPLIPTVADAGIDQNTCATTAAMAANTPISGSGEWSLISGSGVIASINSPVTGISGLSVGANIFRWTISTSPCSSTFDDVIINVSSNPSLSNAGTSQILCASSAVLSANIPLTGNGNWSLISGLGSINNPASATTAVTSLGIGANVFSWTITSGSCPPSSSTVTLTVDANPTTSNAGTNQIVCASATSLAANTPSIGLGNWSVVSGSGTFANAASPTSTVTGLSVGTNVFRWTISNGTCLPSSSTVSINMDASPTSSNAGTNQIVCASSTSLAANTPSVGLGNWSVVSGSGTFANAASPTTNVTGLSVGTNVFRWTISNGSCLPSFSQVIITSVANPTVANAGPDQTNLCGVTAALMAANAPSDGSGVWTITSGIGGSFSLNTNPNATFNGAIGNTYVLRWTISNPPCSDSFDELTVSFSANPTIADAGLDQTGASTCGLSSLSLTGNTPSFGIGTWSIVSGGAGSFSNVNQGNTTFSGAGGNFYILRWTISNLCLSSTDDVSVIFNQNPTIANAGSDQTLVCSATSATLAANIPINGSGAWSIQSGIGGSFSNTTAANAVFTGTANNAANVLYTIRWTISNSPCASNFDDVVITLPRLAATANAGNDITAACGITTTAMNAVLPANHTGLWTIVSGIGGSFSSTANPTATFTGISGNSYNLRWSLTRTTNGCASSDDVLVSFPLNTSIANAGPDQVDASTCGLSQVLLAANLPSIGTGQWSVVSGIGGSFSNALLPSSSFTGAAGSSYVLRWTINNSPCISSSDDVLISFNTGPSSSFAGSDQTLLCGVTSTNLAANNPAVGIGNWTIVSGVGGSFSLASDPSATFSGILGSNYVLRWTISNFPCIDSFDEVNVTFNEIPSTANAGQNQVICTTTCSLAANIPLSGTGIWTLESGSGIFSNSSSPTSNVSGLGIGTNIFRWTISSPSCGASVSDVTVTVNANPSVSVAGPDQFICSPTTFMNANVPTQGIGSWLKISGSGTIANTGSPTSSVSGLLVGANVFEWTISNGVCPPSQSTVTIFVSANPTVANAGTNQTICGNSTTLAGNTPFSGTGFWTLVSGSGIIANQSSENSLVSGMSVGANVFRWTISNAPCASSFSDVIINVSTIPAVADAGFDQVNLCGVTSAVLSANPATGSTTGTWTIVSGLNGLIGSINDPASSFSGILDSTYILRWSISSPGCSDSFDDVVIRFNSPPSTAFAGTDQTVCETNLVLSLSATAPLNGSGVWTNISGSTSFADSTTANTLISGFAVGTNSYLWTVSTVCGSLSDTVIVTVDALPTLANAGINQDVCESSFAVNLSANFASSGSGVWTVLAGTGVVSSPTVESSAIVGLSLGLNSFEWRISNGVCPSSSDTVIIAVDSLPTQAVVANDTAICSTAFSLIGNNPLVGVGNWSVINGNGTIVNTALPTTSVAGLSVGLNSFVWSISNGICGSTADTINVIVNDLPTVSNAGMNQLICSDSTFLSANIALVGDGVWTLVSGQGNFENTSSPTTKISGLILGTTILRWTISNANCAVSFSEVSITVNPQTSIANAGSDDTICGNSATLNANIALVGSGIWTLVSGSGTIVDSSNPTTLVTGLGIGVNSFEWKITNPPCGDHFDTVAITVTSIPSIANAGSDQLNLCGLTSTQLDADTLNQVNGSWLIVSGGGGTFSSNTSPLATFTGFADSTYVLRWTITDPICSSSSDDVVIYFGSSPTPANAGLDQISSSTCGLTSLSLNANAPLNGTGVWAILSGSGGSVSGNSPISSFTGLPGSTYFLEWSITNTCGISKDSVTITFNENPSSSNAGTNQHICENITSVQLNANNASVGSGNWSIASGSGNFFNAASETSNVNGFSNGVNLFVWTISTANCGVSSDTVEVLVSATPSAALAGADQSVCENTSPVSITANQPTVGVGYWKSTSGLPTITDSLASSTSVGNLSIGPNSFVWIISNGVCFATSDTITISVSPNPSLANAGTDFALCETTASVNLGANMPLAGIGTWSVASGAATFLATNLENTPAGGFLPGQNLLVWTISSGACAASSDTVVAFVNSVPTTANAGTDQHICESVDTILLVGNTPFVGIGNWSLITGSGNILFTASDSSTLTDLATGLNSFSWTISNGACISKDTVVIAVDALPTPANAGFDKSICVSYALLKADTAFIGTGIWTVLAGSSGTILNPNFDTTAVVAMAIGANQFAWTISNGLCASSSDTVTITVNPDASISNAGVDQTVCSNVDSVVLAANFPTAGIGRWRLISGSGVFADSTGATTAVTSLGLGVNVFAWVIRNGICTSADAVSVTVTAQPTIANAGSDQTVCENSVSITLAANAATIGIGMWSGTGTFSNSGSANTDVSGFTVGLNSYVWTITNGVCAGSSDTIAVLVDGLPSVSSAGANQSYCINTSSAILLTASTPVVGMGVWASLGTAQVDIPGNVNSSVSNLISGSNSFVWSVTNGTCPASNDTTEIVMDDLPSASNAGGDQSICDTTYTLAANIPNTGVGSWLVISGNGTLLNPSTAAAVVNGLSNGANSFVWTIANGACASSSDTVLLSVFSPPSVANAGANQSVCISNPAANLAASIPTTGVGSWTTLSGTGLVNNTVLANSSVSNLSIGLNSFIWTISNGLCLESKDTVNISVADIPSIATVGANQTVCESAINISVSATAPLIGVGQWSVVQGSGSLSNPNNPTTSIGFSSGVNAFVWTISNGSCPASKDTSFVFVDSLSPIASAGVDQTFCENSAVTLNAVSVGFGSAAWTTLIGGALVSNPAQNNSTASGLSIGQNTFVWISKNGVCPEDSDTASIFIDQSPSFSFAGNDQTICDTTSQIQLQGNNAIVGYSSWFTILGAGIIAQPTDSNSIVGGLVAGVSTFEWVISNGVCSPSRDTVVITVNASPSLSDAGQDQTICENNATANLNGNIPGIGVGVWSLSSGVAFINDTNSASSSVSNLAVGASIFKWTITNGLCKSFSTVQINVDALPSASDAGTDQSVPAPIADLNAVNPVIGIGVWSVSQGSGNFSNENSPSAQINGLAVGANTLLWTVSNGVCPTSADEVIITFKDIEIPNAISPNNDGYNDAFVVPGIEFYSGVKFTVYNSWGGIVYQNLNYQNDFKGENSSGQFLLDDTYYYVLQIKPDLEYKGYLIIKK